MRELALVRVPHVHGFVTSGRRLWHCVRHDRGEQPKHHDHRKEAHAHEHGLLWRA